MTEHKSPIEPLGYAGWKQYSIFKNHLKLPLPYLKVIVKNYRDLTEVPVLLPKLVQHIDTYLWSTMSDKQKKEQLYKTKGVPVPYIRDDSPPISAAKTHQVYELILSDIRRFMERPLALYLHSGFENGALKAASGIVKVALDSGIDARMIGFGALLAETKEWDANSELLKKVKQAPLLCLYMIGREYGTDFTRSVLEELVVTRGVEGKTTLLCSALDPAEFHKRYGFDPQAVPLKFEDERIVNTVNELLAYMKGA